MATVIGLADVAGMMVPGMMTIMASGITVVRCMDPGQAVAKDYAEAVLR